MRVYEEMFIVRPDVTDEEIDPLIEQMRQIVTTSGGTMDKADKMGVRRMAYKVEKRGEGFYVLLQFTSNPQVVKEVERRLRVSDLVMKFLTVRIDEKLKRAEKLRKQKEARAKRKPQAPPAPERPLAEQMMAELPGRPGAPAPGAPLPAPPAPAGPAPDAPAPPAPAPEENE